MAFLQENKQIPAWIHSWEAGNRSNPSTASWSLTHTELHSRAVLPSLAGGILWNLPSSFSISRSKSWGNIWMKKWKSKRESGKVLKRIRKRIKHQAGTSGPLTERLETPGRQTKSLLETGHSHITWIIQSISNHMVTAICKELRGKTFIVGNDTLFAVAYSTLPQFCLLDKQHQCKDNQLAMCLIFDSGQSLTWLKNNKLAYKLKLGKQVKLLFSMLLDYWEKILSMNSLKCHISTT